MASQVWWDGTDFKAWIGGILTTIPLSSNGSSVSMPLLIDEHQEENFFLPGVNQPQLPVFTAGSVIFSNGSFLTEDNANLFWDDTGDYLRIGSTSSTRTSGLVVPHVAGRIEAITFKDSMLAHGITGQTDTNSWATINEVTAGLGGVQFNGASSDTIAFSFQSWYTNDTTTKSSSANAAMTYLARKKSGTGVGNPGAGANLYAIKSGATTRYIFAEDMIWSGKPLVFLGDAAPTMPVNTAGLYANDVAGTVELFAIDEAGISTQLTSHNFSLLGGPSEEMAWSHFSKQKGKEINVDMLRVVRLVEKLTGESLVRIQ